MQWIVLIVPAGVESRLEIDAKDGRVFQAKTDDAADLVIVDASLNSRNQYHRTLGLGQAIQGFDLLF